MHSHHEHRAHSASRKRVGHIMKGGGHAHSDAAADKKLFASMLAKHEASEGVHGEKHGGRLNKYARGGAAKKHGTQVNIAIVGHHGRHADGGVPTPGGPMGLPPGGPPVGLPPGLPPGGPPAGGPPGLPPRPPGMPMGGPPGMPLRPPGMMKRGGKVKHREDGGKVLTPESPYFNADAPGGKYSEKPQSHMKEGPRGGGRAPEDKARGGGVKLGMTAGAFSGEGRLEKAAIQKRKKKG